MQNVIFRASSLGDIVSASGKLTQTGKSKVAEVFLENTLGYKEPLQTKGLEKGHLTESASRILIRKHLGGEARVANTDRIENGWITGEVDSVLQKESVIEDYKAPNNLRTYFNHIRSHKENGKIDHNYWTQGQGYMWLHDKEKYRLCYCLHPYEEDVIMENEKKWYFYYGCDEMNQDYIDICNQIRHNNDLIIKMPVEQRVYVIEFNRDPNFKEKAMNCITEARSYYQQIINYLPNISNT